MLPVNGYCKIFLLMYNCLLRSGHIIHDYVFQSLIGTILQDYLLKILFFIATFKPFQECLKIKVIKSAGEQLSPVIQLHKKKLVCIPL